MTSLARFAISCLRKESITDELTSELPQKQGVVLKQTNKLTNKQTNKQTIGQVRYINIQAWLRGFRVKVAMFQVSFVSQFDPKRDLHTKKTTPNINV